MTAIHRMKSMAVWQLATGWENIFHFSLASDLASTHLSANINNFPTPTRTSFWNNFVIQFNKSHWQINASLLNTNINDKTETGAAASNKNKFTPAFAIGFKPESRKSLPVPLFLQGYFQDAHFQ